MRTFLVIVGLLLTPLAYAQEDYLITARNDTLYGDVTILLASTNDEPVRIAMENDTRQLSAHEFRASFIDGAYYKTIRFGEKYRIMKEIIPGYLGLYEYRPDESHEFGGRFLYKLTNQGLEVSMLFFRNSAAKFLSECEPIVEGLEAKKYGINNVEELVRDYNDMCVEADPSLPTSREKSSIEVPRRQPQENVIEELGEFNTLVSDILNKVTNGEPVPGYMREALRSYEEKDLNDLIKALLEELE